MGRLRAKSDYEELRDARIAANQARMSSLGLEKTAGDLKAFFSSVKSSRPTPRKYTKLVYGSATLRRSDRLKEKSSGEQTPQKLHTDSEKPTISEKLSLSEPVRRSYRRKLFEQEEGEEIRPANAPLLDIDPVHLKLPEYVLSRRCDSKERGSVYDPILGICCHFCRQKKLCGEEDCKRCGDRDMEQPCIGKTDCSVCHSTNGVYCRACLKVRYGEDMEEVWENKNWMCPHCIEEKGINPYWICNSSFCLKKRKIPPTGIAIYRAREMGYKSVAHLLMDELKRAGGEHIG